MFLFDFGSIEFNNVLMCVGPCNVLVIWNGINYGLHRLREDYFSTTPLALSLLIYIYSWESTIDLSVHEIQTTSILMLYVSTGCLQGHAHAHATNYARHNESGKPVMKS